eukprot:CAMPEP_0206476816 /NCGR_PEP_ID=MMETSP0324_2-20121206/34962_1 /ASSEMBLY_ACC=CAM_ASM_000836 /TAXON_ID=2866 /ORGANISM="Crypthecodinium cohnii, Strain Seligo" /LENGTH=431 /DNA_ID=CAMNT_0053952561 /DNA_START=72 /DNA_END=1367 /DNA_ORIENTATION=-
MAVAVANTSAEQQTIVSDVQNTMENELYNQASHNLQRAHAMTYESLRGILRRMHQRQDEGVLRICDLGSAGGVNSVSLMRIILAELRGSLGEKRAISVAFEELPSSDFNTLIQAVTQHQDTLWAPNNVSTAFVARSFYEPLFLKNTMDLALTYITLHWMREAPGKQLPSGEASNKSWTIAGETGMPKELYAAWKAASKEDLTTFLELRAEELKDNAEGLFVMVGGDEWSQWSYGTNLAEAQKHAEETNSEIVLPEAVRTSTRALNLIPAENRHPLKTSIFTAAIQRAVDRNEVPPSVLEKAYVPYFLRTHEDVMEAINAANERSGIAGGVLELVELKSSPVVVGATGNETEDDDSAADLGWSIHAHAIQATSGASNQEMECIKKHYMQAHRDHFDPKQGVCIPFMYMVVRRTPRTCSCSSTSTSAAEESCQ